MLTLIRKAVISQDVTRKGTRASTRTGPTAQSPSSRHPSLRARSNQSLKPLGPASTPSLSAQSNQSIIPLGPVSTSIRGS